MLRKYSVELGIIAGFALLVVLANVASAVRHHGDPVLSASLQQGNLDRTHPFAGLRKDTGASTASLDIALQGNKSIDLGHGKAAVLLPFRRDKTISFTGWAVDGSSPARGVYLIIDGSTFFPAAYGFDRPDVAGALKEPATRQVGFQIDVPPNAIHSGTHNLSIQVVDKTGEGYYTAVPQATIALGN